MSSWSRTAGLLSKGATSFAELDGGVTMCRYPPTTIFSNPMCYAGLARLWEGYSAGSVKSARQLEGCFA